MRSLPTGLQDHLDGGATTLCWCWRLIRADGLVLGFSDHDKPVTFDGTVFEASTGFSASEVKGAIGLSVDNLDVSGALQSGSLNDNDLAAGYFDDAQVEIFRVNWEDVAQRVLVRAGSLGEIKRGASAFTAEIRGLSHYLQQPKGRILQFGCDADVGDGRCGFDLASDNFKASAVVSSVVDGRLFATTELISIGSGWFTRGLVRWTGGGNAGQTVEVKEQRIVGLDNNFELWQEAAYAIEVGDVFEVTAGCDKQFSTCREKFSNGVNFRGFPYIPGNDFVTSYPNRDDPDNDGASRWNK